VSELIPSVIPARIFLQKKIKCLIISSEKYVFSLTQSEGGVQAPPFRDLCILTYSEGGPVPHYLVKKKTKGLAISSDRDVTLLRRSNDAREPLS